MEHREHVAISDLLRVHACPVRFYYEGNGPIIEPDRYLICKQISYHLGRSLDSDVIWSEVLAVRPSINNELRSFMDTCIIACKKTNWTPAAQSDVRVISEKHGIIGIVDRIADDGTFSIIRAAGAMPFGTYSSDRLRIACIAFCLEEMTGKEVNGGNVEYIPDGALRFHTVQPRDRRMVISTLHKIRSINTGDVPTHPLNAPCNRCKFRERCETNSGRRLSDLL